MTAEPTQAAQVSGLALLIRWANEQDHWIRQLVSEVIETRRSLSNERIDELYDWLRREKKIASGDPSVVGMLSSENFDIPAQPTVRLNSLRHVANVNALVEDQEIKFHERMTVCFGENASGKTGYVRILKNAAKKTAKKTAREDTVDSVLPNIYQDGGEKHPQAKFKFLADGQECEIEWTGEQGVLPLTQIDIFDSQVAVFHLKKDMTYSYTPAELRLFPLVKDGIERVQEKLDKQQIRPNPFFTEFPRESRLYSNLERLGASTNLNDLKMLAQISKEQKAKLPRLKEKVVALRSGEMQAQIKKARKEKEVFESTINIADLIGRFEREAYVNALSELKAAREVHENATRAALVGENVPGILGDSWKEFIGAAVVDTTLSERLGWTGMLAAMEELSGGAMESLHERIAEGVGRWREESHPCAEYPLTRVILGYQRYGGDGEDTRRFQALETYWFLRLIKSTLRFMDLDRIYYKGKEVDAW